MGAAEPLKLPASRWQHCYGESWSGIITPESFAHPAKISVALAERIYTHALEAGWIAPGDTVVDPFGGIGGTAYGAVRRKLRWIGCELEPKFVELGRENLRLFESRLPAEWGVIKATMLQGDSRNLVQVMREAGILRGADCCVSSPPYAGSAIEKNSGSVDRTKQYETYRAQGGGASFEKFCATQEKHSNHYGTSTGQLGAMKEGAASAIIVSSPPYAGIATGAGGLNTLPGKDGQQSGRSADSASQTADSHYGEAEGQLGAMPEGDVAAVISSPPFESTEVKTGAAKGFHSYDKNESINRSKNDYISQTAEGNLGNQGGDTFWQAAREIVAQCHQILRPGGMAIWVCKDFVRKGKRVPFSDQWQALCESQGFVLECRHRAMLVEHGGTQGGLFGEDKALQVSRKSFFRRLAESKGSPAIDWEDVICVRKKG